VVSLCGLDVHFLIYMLMMLNIFLCLLTGCVLSLKKCLSQSSVQFELTYSSIYNRVKSSPGILDTNLLSNV
jgi:hypothetical protein